MSDIVLITKKEMTEIFKSVLVEFDNEKTAKLNEKVFTINQIAKRLGRAHDTINKLVKNGMIRTTQDGLITESAINEYLGQ